MEAPTAELILKLGASFDISCGPCRLITVPPDMAKRLVAAGKGAVPVDRLKFRCHRCGGLGEPFVQGPGNSLMGRARLWPPEGREMTESTVMLKMTKPEALALLKAAETGVAFIEALALGKNYSLIKQMVRKLRAET